MPNDPDDFGRRCTGLIARLSQVPSVTRYDDGEYSEAETLADAFLEPGP
jgi:hypothetical protein